MRGGVANLLGMGETREEANQGEKLEGFLNWVPLRLFYVHRALSSRITIALVLLAAAAAKASTGNISGDQDFVLYGVVALEIATAVALIVGVMLRIAFTLVTALALGGLAQAVWLREPCGCFGRWITLGWHTHAALCGVLGVLAMIGWGSAIPKTK